MPENPPTLIHYIDSPPAERTACSLPVNGEPPGWPTVSLHPGAVTCFACRKSQAFKGAQRQRSIVDDFMGVGTPTPMKLSGVMATSPEMKALEREISRRQTPPHLNENDDGVFTFYDVHESDNWTLEVVPQEPSGNVEITIGEGLFTLSHLDRMDLVRALLHGFHYSAEIGGPKPSD